MRQAKGTQCTAGRRKLWEAGKDTACNRKALRVKAKGPQRAAGEGTWTREGRGHSAANVSKTVCSRQGHVAQQEDTVCSRQTGKGQCAEAEAGGPRRAAVAQLLLHRMLLLPDLSLSSLSFLPKTACDAAHQGSVRRNRGPNAQSGMAGIESEPTRAMVCAGGCAGHCVCGGGACPVWVGATT